MKSKKLHAEDCAEDCERARSHLLYMFKGYNEGGQKFDLEDKNENRHKEVHRRITMFTCV